MGNITEFNTVKAKQYIGFAADGAIPAHSGLTIYVHSSGPRDTGLSPFTTTIDAAIGKCRANRDDMVVVLEGHTETISNATSLVADIAGVTIIGLGKGNGRPTITLDTATTTTIPVSAANVTFKNIIFTANFADIVSVFTLTTAKYFRLENCYIKATATNMNFLSVVTTSTTDGNADGLQLINNKWIEPDLATLYMVNQANTLDDVVIYGNYANLGVNNNKASLLNVANGKIVTSLNMSKNIVYRLNTDTATGAILFHTNGSTNTGTVSENFAQHADTAAELLVTASSGLGTFSNYASGVAGASGYLLPGADS